MNICLSTNNLFQVLVVTQTIKDLYTFFINNPGCISLCLAITWGALIYLEFMRDKNYCKMLDVKKWYHASPAIAFQLRYLFSFIKACLVTILVVFGTAAFHLYFFLAVTLVKLLIVIPRHEKIVRLKQAVNYFEVHGTSQKLGQYRSDVKQYSSLFYSNLLLDILSYAMLVHIFIFCSTDNYFVHLFSLPVYSLIFYYPECRGFLNTNAFFDQLTNLDVVSYENELFALVLPNNFFQEKNTLGDYFIALRIYVVKLPNGLIVSHLDTRNHIEMPNNKITRYVKLDYDKCGRLGPPDTVLPIEYEKNQNYTAYRLIRAYCSKTFNATPEFFYNGTEWKSFEELVLLKPSSNDLRSLT